MKQLKIKDNTALPRDAFAELPNLVGRIADKTLKRLEEDGVFVFPERLNGSEDLSEEQMILRSVNSDYRSSNVMGFLGLGQERLIIGSRFGSEQNDFFLQYLLERVLDFPNIVEHEADASEQDRILNLMVFLFPRYLKSAMRKGLFKTYVRNAYNDSNPKGTVDVAAHIKQNVPFVGKVAYQQREYSYDNELTELIRHTIEVIRQKSFGKQLLHGVRNEVKRIVEVTARYRLHDRRKVLAANKKKTVRHAYYHEYRMLQRLCILILENQKNAIGAGSKQVYGLLFDGAWLWEEYLHTLVGDRFHHPKNKAGSGVQWLFTTDANAKRGEIYPDFIGKNAVDRVIADAKYKPIENVGKGNADYFQLLAYMLRFDAKKGLFFYPESGDTAPFRLRLNQGSSYDAVAPRPELCVWKLGLKIPTAADYREFSEKMAREEAEFLQRLEKA